MSEFKLCLSQLSYGVNAGAVGGQVARGGRAWRLSDIHKMFNDTIKFALGQNLSKIDSARIVIVGPIPTNVQLPLTHVDPNYLKHVSHVVRPNLGCSSTNVIICIYYQT